MALDYVRYSTSLGVVSVVVLIIYSCVPQHLWMLDPADRISVAVCSCLLTCGGCDRCGTDVAQDRASVAGRAVIRYKIVSHNVSPSRW